MQASSLPDVSPNVIGKCIPAMQEQQFAPACRALSGLLQAFRQLDTQLFKVLPEESSVKSSHSTATL